MAHAGVDRLGVPGGRPVAATVIRRAEKRAALDDLARDPQRRVAFVITVRLTPAARIFRDAACLRRIRRVPRRVPVGRPERARDCRRRALTEHQAIERPVPLTTISAAAGLELLWASCNRKLTRRSNPTYSKLRQPRGWRNQRAQRLAKARRVQFPCPHRLRGTDGCNCR
jgi:hypothetical protein